MICGFFVGVILALAAFGIGYCALDNVYTDKAEKITVAVTAIVCVLCVVGSATMGVGVDNNFLKRDIESFRAVKSTYEVAANDQNVSDLERLQIVEVAITQNAELASEKVSLDAWWNAFIDEDLKAECKQLEQISVERGGN